MADVHRINRALAEAQRNKPDASADELNDEIERILRRTAEQWEDARIEHLENEGR